VVLAAVDMVIIMVEMVKMVQLTLEAVVVEVRVETKEEWVVQELYAFVTQLDKQLITNPINN
tara:strand:- start:10 stop:195 length:186 start_codon:yes stop_codon:yes gene_type:complete